MRIVTDDGVGLEVVDRGAGPALVLVHGFGGAKEDFSDHVEALARDHRVITLDLRGHGESDGPADEASYSLDRFAADIANVADALDLPTVRLLGHSMGGMIVRRFVLACPDRVEALVLMDTSPGPVPGMDAELIDLGVQIAREQGMDELKRVMDAFSPLGTAAYERTLVERPGYREFNDRKWETLSPAMYTKMLVEIRDQPDELDDAARRDLPDARDRRGPGLALRGRVGGDGRGDRRRPLRGDPRCRSLPAVREPAGVAREPAGVPDRGRGPGARRVAGPGAVRPRRRRAR